MRLMTRGVVLTILLGLLAACAPAPGTTSRDTPSSAPELRAAPKVLALVGREGVIGNFPGVQGGGGGQAGFVHDYLTVTDPSDRQVERLAAEVISVDRGTWKLNADGSMDTIWTIRPNIKWHDGTPFTADDLMFTYTAYKDPALPSFYGEALKLMTSAEALDPLTFVVHWSQPYAEADKAPGLDPMPRHLLEDLYTNNKETFPDSPRFRRDFVGTGAYRIKNWEPGSHIEYERFDDYYLGRPPLDTVIVRFMSDKNTILSNILAGTLDMVFHKDALDIEAALEAVKRWEGTGNQVRWVPAQRVISVEIQYRPEFARPQNGLTNRDVRLALMHAIDRKELVAAVSHAFSPIADSWITPTSKWAAAVEGASPHYEYDVARAQRLLADVGWTRGPDGILVNPGSGERFETDLWNRFQLQRDQAIVADYWKAVGVQANAKQLPIQRDRELEAKINGGQMMDQTIADYAIGRLRSTDISTPANRYNGRNLGGYSNPRLDALLNKLAITIDAREAANVHRDLAQEAFTDLALLPFYFQVTPLLLREGVTGPEGGVNVNWNFHEWDKKA